LGDITTVFLNNQRTGIEAGGNKLQPFFETFVALSGSLSFIVGILYIQDC